MAIEHYRFEIPGPLGKAIAIDLRLPKNVERPPLVLLLHGFKGFKEWGFFPYLEDHFAEQGFASLALNFSHNGIAGHGTEFVDLEGFERNSYGLMLENIDLILDFINDAAQHEAHSLPDNWVDRSRLVLLGHSMGGGVALLAAERHPQRFRGVATWNPVGRCDRYGPEQKEELQDLGYINVPNMRTGQLMRVSKTFFDDLETHADERDVEKAASNLSIPLLVVQGSNDEAVPAEESAVLAQVASDAKLVTISGAGHTFNAGHPFESCPDQLTQAIDATTDFLKRVFG